MQVAIRDRKALRAVSPRALSAYARAAGWRKVDEYGYYSDVYVADDLPEIIIPRTNKLGDYVNVVSQLVQIFATAADTDELSLYRDLIVADRDVIRVRASPGDDDGSITIRHGLGLMRGTYDMLAAAVCSLVDAQPVIHSRPSGRLKDFLDNVHLGQTEQSSYVVTLLTSTLSPKIRHDLDSDDPDLDDVDLDDPDVVKPIDRQATLRLVEALEEARRASERSVSDESLPLLHSVKYGVSANFCEAVATLVEPFRRVDVSVTWARSRPVKAARSVVTLGKNHAPFLREAARVFRLRAPRPDVFLTGPVMRLARGEEETDGTIVLRAHVDGKVRAVKAVLRQSDYVRAVQAHSNKVPIVVCGDLERVGQRWRLLNPKLASVISDMDGDSPQDAEGLAG